MEDPLRKQLQGATQDARRLLEREFAEQLEGDFNILPDGQVLDDPRHLNSRQLITRRKLLETLAHRQAAGKDAAEAVDDYTREAAFTFLNRMIALKMLEARGLLQPCVSKGEQSSGFKEFTGLAPGLLELPDHGYRLYLECLFDEIGTEVKVLFDRRDPASLLWPRRQALLDLLAVLNADELAGVWGQDETIGWVYQYFNSQQERRDMRDASQAPRNSHELAVRNQFFTPRYVVQFLTDNTLGRIWYEMRRGDTKLVEQCHYLVRRPKEVFLTDFGQDVFDGVNTGIEAVRQGDLSQLPETASWDDLQHLALAIDGYQLSEGLGLGDCDQFANATLDHYRQSGQWQGSSAELWICLFFEQRRWRHFGDEPAGKDMEAITALYAALRRALTADTSNLSQQELLNLPVCIPRRPKKDPRDLKVLDPACGSGHFHLYCFDLFLTIYEEAWEDADSPPAKDAKGPDGTSPARTLREDYPTIDKLREALPGLILHYNLHGIDIDPRCAQIAAFALWMRAQRAYNDLGLPRDNRPPIRRTNIAVAEPMPGEKEMLREFCATLDPPLIGQLVEVIFEKMKLAGEVGSLLRIEEEIRQAIATARDAWATGPETVQLRLFGQKALRQPRLDFSGITDADFWRHAEQRIYQALRDYAACHTNGSSFGRRLFADDAEHGFAFIDLSSRQYDVCLMNPPFGQVSVPSRDYLYARYVGAAQDIFSSFVDRGLELLTPLGMLGAITSRLAFFLELLEKWRHCLLGEQNSLAFLADLGYGVLDAALVEAAAYIVNKRPATSMSAFFSALDALEKHQRLHEQIACAHLGQHQAGVFFVDIRTFRHLPASRTPYWVSSRWRRLYHECASLEEYLGFPYVGLQTGNDEFLLRLAWEVPEVRRSQDPVRWVPFAKGGEYAPIFGDYHLCVDWDRRSLARRTSNDHAYLRAGITYTERTTSNISARVLPPGCAFSPNGVTITPDPSLVLVGAVLLGSRPVQFLVEMSIGSGDAVHSGSAARHYGPRVIASTPAPKMTRSDEERLASLGDNIWRHFCEIGASAEDSRYFVHPYFPVRIQGQSVAAVAELLLRRHEDSWLDIIQATGEAETLIGHGYGITAQMREEMVLFLGEDPARLSTTGEIAHESVCDDYSATIETIVSTVAGQVGASRGLTKKCYAADRRLELLAVKYGVHPRVVVAARRRSVPSPIGSVADLAERTVSYAIGCALGRWDPGSVGGASDGRTIGPLDPLPVRPPGMPIEMDRYEQRVEPALSGIVVDDPGHPADIVGHVRNMLGCIWGESADSVYRELSCILDPSGGEMGLRRWLRSSFFCGHIGMYSKSRRKAPIYWELAPPSGSYAVWIYCHRFTKDTFYQVLKDYVKPKGNHERLKLDRLRAEAGPNPTPGKRRDMDAQEAFVAELMTFQEEVERIVPLWDPDLNDGVIINFAPLWRLVKLRSWQKECKECWDKLVAEEYDWAHLAMHLWPERVVPKCADDRSLAIAHCLEDLFWVEDIDGWRKLKKPDDEIKLQKARRQFEARDRMRDLLAELAQGPGRKMPAAEVWRSLSSGDWDDKQVAWMLWPERVAAKCWADPIFAKRIGLNVPAKQTKAAEKKFADNLVSEGCPDLAAKLEAALADCQDPFGGAWKGIAKGERDELAIALSLWPDRVVDKCADDVALAERHAVRPFLWYRGTEDTPWRPREAPKIEITNEAARRHNPAVQAALESLLAAPLPGGSPGRRTRRRRDSG